MSAVADPTATPCPMCQGTGERYILGVTIACAWCSGRRLVTIERGRQLRAPFRGRRVNELVALIAVYGTPEPAGSKRWVGRVVDANPRAKGWQANVARAAAEQYTGELLDGPLAVEMIFYRVRPRGHFGTGRNAHRVKPSAPIAPVSRPDALKLARAVEDALEGVVYRNDAQIVEESLAKRWGEPERCEIAVYRMGTVAAREAAETEEAVA